LPHKRSHLAQESLTKAAGESGGSEPVSHPKNALAKGQQAQ